MRNDKGVCPATNSCPILSVPVYALDLYEQVVKNEVLPVVFQRGHREQKLVGLNPLLFSTAVHYWTVFWFRKKVGHIFVNQVGGRQIS